MMDSAHSATSAGEQMQTPVEDDPKYITVHKNRDGTVDTHDVYITCARCKGAVRG